jgi:hypothetical protein
MVLVVLAALAGLEGLGLLAYAAFDLVSAVRVGITGPAEVSNPAALAGLIAITAAFGAALIWVALGWWRGRTWARSPFVVAQLVLGLIGYEISQSGEGGLRMVGQVAMVVAVTGIVLVFLPSARRALSD